MNTMQGYFIEPNDNMIKLPYLMSHREFIKIININIQDLSNTLEWSQSEIDNNLNIDTDYIIIKSGFIRILTFLNQVGIDIFNKEAFENKKYIIFKLLQKFNITATTLILNFVGTNTFETYNSVTQFIEKNDK